MSGPAWAFVLLALALGFAALHLPLTDGPWRFVPALLFPLMPLLALRAVAGPLAWRALFRRPTLPDLALAAAIALLNLAVTFAIGALISEWIQANANPAISALGQQGIAEVTLFFAATIPQLLGEELLTILPFLALLTGFRARFGWSRRSAILWAWLLSALPFALAHLPTYQWNWLQCLLIIGTSRLVLTLAYLWSRNLLVSSLAHILNDWMLFGTVLALSGHGLQGG